MNSLFGSVFWLLVTLGVLVTFHEFGHYWVARKCGVKVLRFSVGFGKALWKRVGRDGTEYQIAAIPLGGYVKMLDAREGDVPSEDRAREFTGKPVWQRIAIVVAGPAFNLIFTVVAFWLMFTVGMPDFAPVVTATPHSMAAEAGVREGDRILSIDGRKTDTSSDSFDALANGLLARETIVMQVRGKDGAERSITLPFAQLPAGEDIGQYFKTLGLKSAPRPALASVVQPGKPASLAGVQVGDRLVSVNGQAVEDFEDFARLVAGESAKSPQLNLVVERDHRQLSLSMTAVQSSEAGQPSRWMVGIGAPEPEQVTRHFGPVAAMGESLRYTWENTTSIFNMIAKMVTGQASTKNLSGVIGIAQVANDSASMGPVYFLKFLALVSLSLAVLNLLPIPVLDGGHLLYYLIELVKGSPLSERAMMAGQYVGIVLLFTLMGLAFYNDIHRNLPL
ncbi:MULTISPECIES: RIP metalloprotease RseP [Dyella]|uniref:Zinc metalloprotease n=2 Tax=Dyella TaxID=231454 RepID=A0A4R0YW21_9GAMM|nr:MULTISPECIES: RIP metalloprotease RseP [Dyella]TBR38756.1 RIP metalloprotease RseP [Dyella terrae]TCI13653.1 RIP metalloprotease RseP [Dyella soli]